MTRGPGPPVARGADDWALSVALFRLWGTLTRRLLPLRIRTIESFIAYFATAPGISSGTALLLYGLSALGSFMTAAMGLGGGLLMLGALSAFYPPAIMIPLHAIVQLGSNGGRVLVMPRHVMVRYLPVFVVGSALGAAAGTQIFVTLPGALLQAILGAFILYMIWGPPIRALAPRKQVFFGLGLVATFAGLFVGVTGPLLAPVVAAASPDRRDVVSTHAAMMSIIHILKIAAFGVIGFAFAPYAGFIVGMIGTGFLGTVAGRYLLYRLPERAFRLAFRAVMTFLAARLLYLALVTVI